MIYTNSYLGFVTLPCHGLVDTGAQDGVIGLWHFQRWYACLAHLHGLRPRFEKIAPGCVAGGIGGQARTLGIVEMPMGIVGACGLCFSVVLEDPSPDQTTPP